MILTVYRNNKKIDEIDLSHEIRGVEEARCSFFIGRKKDCHVVIKDMEISREFAEIIHEKNQWILKKKSSMGIMSVNGEHIDEKNIENGDMAAIGSYQLVFSEENSSSKSSKKATSEDITSEKATLEEAILEEKKLEFDKMPDDLPEQTPEQTGSQDMAEDFPEQEEQVDDEFQENQEVEGFSDEPEGILDEQKEINALALQEENTQILNSFLKYELEIFGENAPYDRFSIDIKEILIGRNSKKCQIILNDHMVSGIHAKIKNVHNKIEIEDLESANGIILNGKRINKADLASGDEFIIGSTTFTLRVQSDILEEEGERLMPVEVNQISQENNLMEAQGTLSDLKQDQFTKEESANKSLFASIMNDPVKKKRIIMYGSVGLVALMLFSEDPQEKKEEKKEVTKKEQSHLLQPEQEEVEEEQEEKITLSPEQQESLERSYRLSERLFEEGKFSEVIFELDKIFLIDPYYKESRQRYQLAKKGLERLEELEKKRREEEEHKIKMEKTRKLLVKAKDAVEKKKMDLAESLFPQILILDPENFDVAQLKLEVEAYKKEQDRLALEKAQKEAERKRQIGFFTPGKKYYLSGQWHKAIVKLESFLEKKNIDEDLVEEAGKLLALSRQNLNAIIRPKFQKARSLREGQNLKEAYEIYKDILKHNPGSNNALAEMNDIRETLGKRSKKIYREAIVAEDLSLFENAKEKLEEVRQISPSDSIYYKKATAKLKEYLD